MTRESPSDQHHKLYASENGCDFGINTGTEAEIYKICPGRYKAFSKAFNVYAEGNSPDHAAERLGRVIEFYINTFIELGYDPRQIWPNAFITVKPNA